jgi:hypothetical protein
MSDFTENPSAALSAFVAAAGGVVIATEPVDGGFPESAWVSLSQRLTGLPCLRAGQDLSLGMGLDLMTLAVHRHERDLGVRLQVEGSVVWARWVDATQVPPHAEEASF